MIASGAETKSTLALVGIFYCTVRGDYVRSVKLFMSVTLVLVACGLSMASMASASDPLFLVSDKTFTIEGQKATLTTEGNPFASSCEKVKGTGTVENDKDTFTATLDYEGCNANTLGDLAKTMLFKVTGETCVISTSPELVVGLYFETTENVHVENVPISGLYILLKGSSDVGAITPINVATKDFTVKFETSSTGVQKVKECTGLVVRKPSIKVSINEAASEVGAAIEQTVTILLEHNATLDG
jgi:hypothetical protein